MKNLFQIGQDNLIKKEYIRKNGYDFEDKESYFQDLIAKNSKLLPSLRDTKINGTYGDIHFLLREFVLPVGRIDDLFIDSNGSFVIVETKLFKNPEGKREVIAQILDYVSYIFSGELSYEELITRLNIITLRSKKNKISVNAHNLITKFVQFSAKEKVSDTAILISGVGLLAIALPSFIRNIIYVTKDPSIFGSGTYFILNLLFLTIYTLIAIYFGIMSIFYYVSQKKK